MENKIFGDANIAAVAVLMSEAPRAAMLAALADGRALPAGELAYRAQVTAQTASTHLSRLVEGDSWWLKHMGDIATTSWLAAK